MNHEVPRGTHFAFLAGRKPVDVRDTAEATPVEDAVAVGVDVATPPALKAIQFGE
ncbi:hypothetical protein [Myxococcus xanthus]|uniref:Uncharacterized protein n=1 Tax=Myxococcus xanthus TaxID=34 RepID=A0A7Y4IIE3_MYXXA|nr:hypothetical protein [Myxococcus xanthus]NOJ79846.1 hypothetical protein [Myxococcus xanthus]NOJ86488.1 hypothetical protein [Myxococcus xanthus]